MAGKVCGKMYLLLYLCSVTVTVLSANEPTFIRLTKNVEIVNLTKHIQEVYFGEKLVTNSSILTYSYPTEKPTKNEHANTTVYTANALYAATICKFANWTIIKIFDFIKLSTLFYQNDARSFVEIFKPHFDRSVQNLQQFVDIYVQRFLRLLNNFLEADSAASYYKDTSVLKALITFKVKMYFISLEDEEQQTEAENSDAEKIRLVLEEMTALQKVLSMNCVDLPNANKYVQMYGYWIPVSDDTATDHGTAGNVTAGAPGDNDGSSVQAIQMFFMEFCNMTLLELSDCPHCETKHMFLENIVAVDLFDRISCDILNASVRIADAEKMFIKDVYQLARVSYDVDIIPLYQDAVLAVIIKLMFDQIIRMLNAPEQLQQQLSEEIQAIETLRDDLEKSYSNNNVSNLSSDLYRGLNILAKLKDSDGSNNNNTVQDVKNFYGSLKHIELDSTTIDHNDDRNNIKKYFADLIRRLTENSVELKCYNLHFKYLGYVHDKHRTTSLESKISLLPTALTTGNRKPIDRNCNLVLKIYTTCLEAVRHLNKFEDIKDITEWKFSKQYFERSKELLSIVKYTVIETIEKNEDDSEIINAAYNIAIILVNLRVETQDKVHHYAMNRAFNRVLTELNSYALKRCTPPNFNFLLFNNINFYTLGTLNSMLDPADRKYAGNNHELLEKYKFLSAQYLYENFIKKSKVCDRYKEQIKFYWNGRLETIHTIYENAILLTLNPRQLYALYDVYFKFYVAAIYLEINHTNMGTNDARTVSEKFSKIKETLNGLKSMNFSREMESLIMDIGTVLSPTTEMTDTTGENAPSKRIEIIGEKFKQFNVVIAAKRSAAGKFKAKLKTMVKSDNLSDLNKEVIYVKIVNANFLRLMRQPVE